MVKSALLLRFYGTYCKPRANNCSHQHKYQEEGRKAHLQFLGADSEAGGPKSSGYLAVLSSPCFPHTGKRQLSTQQSRAPDSRQCQRHVMQALAVEPAVGAGPAEFGACAPFVCRLDLDRFIFQCSPHLTPVCISQHTLLIPSARLRASLHTRHPCILPDYPGVLKCPASAKPEAML